MNMPFKQRRIDNGQIGGAIQMVIQSMFIFNFVTFVNTCALAYTSFLHDYVSLQTAIVLILVGAFGWWITYYAIIYPSILRFANRQSYNHGSPIKDDLEELHGKVDRLMEALELEK